MSCKCAKPTDEWHGWECEISGGACMYLVPDSKRCAAEYGEGPDANIESDIFEVASCRICGCTDAYACPGGCYLVEADLCSQCAGAIGILRTVGGKNESVFN